MSVGDLKDGKVTPYSDAEMNGWRNALKDKIEAKDHFVCVQTIEADHTGHLRMLDPPHAAMGALVPGGAKMVKIDLATNKAVWTIFFDDNVTPQGRFSPDISPTARRGECSTAIPRRKAFPSNTNNVQAKSAARHRLRLLPRRLKPARMGNDSALPPETCGA